VNYYLAEGTTQRGPFSEQELAGAGLRPESLVWREGMPQWQPAQQVPELQWVLFPQAPATAQPTPLPMPGASPIPGTPPATVSYATPAYATYPSPSDISGKKIAAGICGILLGTFGVHKFVLGLNSGAITMLVISLSCIVLGAFTCGLTWMALPAMHIIGLIEGIIYLTKADAEFYQTYLVQKRQWF
jgi:TM2 domain-containing membrane protein YozV